MGVRLTIHVRNADRWLLQVIERIVEGKREMGMPATSVSAEFVRLAKNGYKRGLLGEDLPGAEADRKFGVIRMILARVHIDEFADFVRRTYGVKGTIVHRMDVTRRLGEIGRFMLGGRLVVIREHLEGAGAADTVEVHCADRKKLDELMNAWAAVLHMRMEESDAVDESGDANDV